MWAALSASGGAVPDLLFPRLHFHSSNSGYGQGRRLKQSGKDEYPLRRAVAIFLGFVYPWAKVAKGLRPGPMTIHMKIATARREKALFLTSQFSCRASR